jgi:hypothetical protein
MGPAEACGVSSGAAVAGNAAAARIHGTGPARGPLARKVIEEPA